MNNRDMPEFETLEIEFKSDCAPLNDGDPIEAPIGLATHKLNQMVASGLVSGLVQRHGQKRGTDYTSAPPGKAT